MRDRNADGSFRTQTESVPEEARVREAPASRSSSLLTLRQLSAETGLPLATLYELCAPHGDLPVIRPAKKRGDATRGRIYVQRSDWEAWISAHRVTSAAPIVERAVVRKSFMDLPGADRFS